MAQVGRITFSPDFPAADVERLREGFAASGQGNVVLSGPPVEYAVVCSLSQALASLEQLVGALDRFTLMRVKARDWEARTLAGTVGRGLTATDAVVDLERVIIRDRANAGRSQKKARTEPVESTTAVPLPTESGNVVRGVFGGFLR